MKKKNVPGSGPSGDSCHMAAVETASFSAFPSVIAHLVTLRYEDGDSRLPGWLMVRTNGSAWTVHVKDPDSCMQFSATAASIDDAFVLAELLLSADEAPWEPDPFAKKRKNAQK